MIQRQLKLRPTTRQEAQLGEWLWMLTGVWNFAVRKIEQDAKNGVYYTSLGFQNLLANHGKKMGVPSHTLQGVLSTVHTAWSRCFKKIAGKPKLKGNHNKLNSIPFPDPLHQPAGNRIMIPGLKSVRFHKQELPAGKIKCGRIVKRASGWYLCLFIDVPPNAIQRTADNRIGIDSGFKHLLTLSDGTKIEHPRELEASARRLAQAQRGKRRKLMARLHERVGNQRKDRNHKLSRRLVAENELIAFSADRHKAIARKFGKSVTSSGHAQLRKMLSYKSTKSGRRYIEVNPAFSTKTCSACGCPSGPSGLSGLAVRQWVCTECGTTHDRDINAARNTLIAGLGQSHEGGLRHAA